MASKTTTPGHAHPHEAVPVRIARESGFAGPGSTCRLRNDALRETQAPTKSIL
jgi:hypothetical protein